MNALLRMTSLAALAATALSATPALAAVSPTGPVAPATNATATARIVKPLTLTSIQNLDLGTILMSGTTAWTGATIAISKTGVFTCTNTNVVCSGTTQVAKYQVTGTNKQVVTVSAPNVTLTNNVDGSTLLLTVDKPLTVTLPNAGNTGVEFSLGGSITIDSTTSDGVYKGDFDVTVDYS